MNSIPHTTAIFIIVNTFGVDYKTARYLVTNLKYATMGLHGAIGVEEFSDLMREHFANEVRK